MRMIMKFSRLARRWHLRRVFASVFPLRWLIGCRCAGKKACLRVRRKNWNRTYRSQKFSFPALLWYYFHRLVRYSTASLFSVLLDYVVFMTALFFGAPSLAALIVGRAFSMAVNFTLLRKFVYRDRPELARAWLRYLGLTLFSSAAAFFAIETLRRMVPLPVVIVKALVETTLFFFNYMMHLLEGRGVADPGEEEHAEHADEEGNEVGGVVSCHEDSAALGEGDGYAD